MVDMMVEWLDILKVGLLVVALVDGLVGVKAASSAAWAVGGKAG